MNTLKPEILLLNYLTPSGTDCVLLFGNSTFKKGIITNDTNNPGNNPLLVPNSHTWGTWEQTAQHIILNFNCGNIQHFIYNNSAQYYVVKNGNKQAFYYASANLKLINLAIPLLNEQAMATEVA